MDAVIVLGLALVYMLVYRNNGKATTGTVISEEKIVPNTALNPEMIHDEHAFMVIANELGFH